MILANFIVLIYEFVISNFYVNLDMIQVTQWITYNLGAWLLSIEWRILREDRDAYENFKILIDCEIAFFVLNV